MTEFFAELKRRHIYRVAAAYVVVAWVAIQFFANVAPILDLPAWVARAVLLVLIIGFPVAIIFAWVHQLARPTPPGQPERAATSTLDWTLIGALAVVIALVSYQQLAPASVSRTAQQTFVSPAGEKTGAISIAVLPFVNLSSDKEQEFFSDGMTEEITSALAKVSGMTVLGRTSAFQFKGQNRDLRDIGQALGATHLIEGSVRKAGTRVRITAQLIRADNGVHLWTENYDREMTDVFAIQEDIAQAIAGALSVPLGLQKGEVLVSNRTSDNEVYDDYLRARALSRVRAVAEAIKILEPTVKRDPNYAPAWALLANAYSLAPLYTRGSGEPPEESRRIWLSYQDKAEMAARRAVQLDPKSATGFSALALIQSLGGNWVAAEDLSRQALTLDPNDPDALHFYSMWLSAAGRVRQSVEMRERLHTLEPFVPVYNLDTAYIRELNGQREASLSSLEAVPLEGAVGARRNIYLANIHAAAGRYGEAADAILAIPSNQTLYTRQSWEDAARLLRNAPAKASNPPALEGELNFVYAYIGAPDRVLDSLERSVQTRVMAPIEFRLLWQIGDTALRKTDRFKTLMRKAGLVDYWKARGWPDLCHPMGADDFVCD